MSRFKLLPWLCLAVFISGIESLSAGEELFMGEPIPEMKPVRFAEESIGNEVQPHSRLTFSPDGQTMYWSAWSLSDGMEGRTALFQSDLTDGRLGKAQISLFLQDMGVKGFSYDETGRQVLWGAARIWTPSGEDPVKGIWYSDLLDRVWSEPRPVAGTLDRDWLAASNPSLSRSGNIYFSGRKKGEAVRLYVVRKEHGGYRSPKALNSVINRGQTLDPFIDPDERFILFAGSQRPECRGIMDLFVSFRQDDGSWGPAINLGREICTPFMERFPQLSPDGRYLFFVSARGESFPAKETHYYWVSSEVIWRLQGTTS